MHPGSAQIVVVVTVVVDVVVGVQRPHDHGHVCCSSGSAHVTIEQNTGSWSAAIEQSTIPPIKFEHRILFNTQNSYFPKP